MADITFRDMFWQLRPDLPGIPEPLLFMHYARAVQEHLLYSKAWNYNSDALHTWTSGNNFVTVTAGTHTPTGTVVIQPTALKWEATGDLIQFRTRDWLDAYDDDWESATGSKPIFWTITAPGTFVLYPGNTATTSNAVRGRFAVANLLPTSAATNRVGMPQELALEYQDHWANGALARLLNIPGNNWTNTRLASQYERKFDLNKKEAKARAGADGGRPERQTSYGGIPMGGADTLYGDYGP